MCHVYTITISDGTEYTSQGTSWQVCRPSKTPRERLKNGPNIVVDQGISRDKFDALGEINEIIRKDIINGN